MRPTGKSAAGRVATTDSKRSGGSAAQRASAAPDGCLDSRVSHAQDSRLGHQAKDEPELTHSYVGVEVVLIEALEFVGASHGDDNAVLDHEFCQLRSVDQQDAGLR